MDQGIFLVVPVLPGKTRPADSRDFMQELEGDRKAGYQPSERGWPWRDAGSRWVLVLAGEEQAPPGVGQEALVALRGPAALARGVVALLTLLLSERCCPDPASAFNAGRCHSSAVPGRSLLGEVLGDHAGQHDALNDGNRPRPGWDDKVCDRNLQAACRCVLGRPINLAHLTEVNSDDAILADERIEDPVAIECLAQPASEGDR